MAVRHRLRVLVLVLAAAVVAGCGSAPPPAPAAPAGAPPGQARDAQARNAGPAPADGSVLAFADAQLAATADTLAPPAYPVRTNPDGSWLTKPAKDWTAGFLPAALWRVFERTQDPVWRERAERWQAPLTPETAHDDTDLGFKMYMTFAVDHQLTGDEAAKQTALAAADTLAARFDPTVGMIRVWDERDDQEKYQVNIDAMMNLELLYWAAQNGRPQYADIANRHADRTITDLVRPDGSTSMFGGYDQRTGALLRTYTEQGARDDSTWARGQAWAAYGFAMAYRYTQDPRFLDTAHRTADWFLGHLPPDRVPYWDFDVPQAPPEPRDTSAAAVTASALLAMNELDTDPAQKTADVDGARGMLASLSSPAYLARGTPFRSVLLHGTQNVPEGQADTGIMFGDYYFVEALTRWERQVGPSTQLTGG
ncbi:glycoside hydrolase family 88 protein [Actinomycetospora lemnae]|uniref:Glycoside hydrolase family 88 protein n=1 Tax=Actinomycetospora lemnae TaxID=3019891 RepID=A0ABT5SVH3_9PSEU|nr:glycoside hydrolase family 88 protein [Actinomycetospora sp. DW7H6]MDD7966847.1 glycoside hydrolase family 88 protein [Actinomycetospora sp. DW7H6]